MIERFYSNGKLLLTGEYVVLDGAKALAVPTSYGQSLEITPISSSTLLWESIDHEGVTWFQHTFEDVSRIHVESHHSEIAQTLAMLLQEAKRLNPAFLSGATGFHIKTQLSFPRNWGLGSSSTLIYNIATWANVNPYELLWNAFSGSGYDIACAQHNTPITYQLKDKKPVVNEVKFHPTFADQLYFVHLNKKQNSRSAIAQYVTKKDAIANNITSINAITEELISSASLLDFELLLTEHEQLISGIIEEIPVKERLFPDYFGTVKSLGAWGGDFVLATGNEDTPKYFTKKGYTTIIPYSDMVL